MDAIVVEDLRKHYGDVQALNGVSFKVAEGEVFGLLGPNGAGKTTTVKVLSTLTKPDSGRAEVVMQDVVKDPNGVRRSIGYVPQTSGVDRDATGRENLTLQGRIQRMRGAQLEGARRRAARARGHRRRGESCRPRLLGRDEAAARRRARARPPPARRLPRRADDRSRSRGARDHVGGARPDRRARGAHHPADHALPRGGRPPRQPPRHREPRAGRRRGNARTTSSRASKATR